MATLSHLPGLASDKTRELVESSSCGLNNRSLRVVENVRKKGETNPFQSALNYLSNVQEGTVVRGNDELERNLVVVETVALCHGLPPDAISLLLDLALSLRAGGVTCMRILKFLIPASVVPQEAIVRSVSWLCVGKLTINAQVLFLRWVLTVFDLIDCKDQLRSVYGFIFSFVTEENLCPFICHLLYLLTMKEHVQPYRVRKLMDIQAKMGTQPFLMQLLAVYKVFRPELVTHTLPSRMKTGFKNYSSTWKAALSAVQKGNMAEVIAHPSLSVALKSKSTSRKRKLHCLEVPGLSSAFHTSSVRKVFRLQELRSFTQLLQNIHNIELPAQMGSLLGSSLALHYLDCVQDKSAFLRLNFWLGHSLQEEFLLCPEDGGSNSLSEASAFLSTILSSQQFLQEGFFSTESFLYKFLSVWDGSLLCSQILDLLSHIPLMSSHSIKMLVFEPLIQLYFTSNVFFKCSVIECLNSMLLKWLTWHSVNPLMECLDISVNSTVTLTLPGFIDTVTEIVSFVGGLATEGLRLENGHILLLNHSLSFYETVCDMLVKYDLPVVIMPPAGVFYPALFATDSLTVDRLGYVMYRYRKNLSLAKKQEQPNEKTFHISRTTYQDFNKQLLAMVSCLWNSKSFLPGTTSEIDEHLLIQSKVPKYWTCFDLIYHPAFFKYAIEFHQKCWPERVCVDLANIKVGRYWSWYMEFLFCQGFDGLNDFIQVNTGQSSSSSST
ncbi:centromere protein I isoform X1 [Neoarius graeffei]|uniref:centromere protein I isoform X1 n=2 Tax=Neoarius graeffei TaxID=443677 RepID=UPI00298C2B91|nr:centromere protein I isoform X1 [Neoarius graeffei]XP_060783505.1 centromere protein I isoform X1 [Neoarius graeffei]